MPKYIPVLDVVVSADSRSWLYFLLPRIDAKGKGFVVVLDHGKQIGIGNNQPGILAQWTHGFRIYDGYPGSASP